MFNRKVVICLVIFVLVPLILLVLRFGVGGWSAQSLVVSPQTTVIEGPLGTDGYPDYIAALDKEMSEGVTPDNNAAVLLLRAMGPREIPQTIQAEFYKRIGVSPLADTRYFIDWPQYCKSIPADEQAKIVPASGEDAFQFLIDMQEEAGERPWSREEFPHLAKWLDTNAEPLELIVKASRLPRYYAPPVSDQDPPTLVSMLLPLTQQSRDAALALHIRAMLRLKEQQYEGAWDDLMACRRLGRLVGQGPVLIDALVGYAIEELGVAAQKRFVADANLTVQQWAGLEKELDSLPPRTGLAVKFDRGERFMTLDLILAVARQGPDAMSFVMPGRIDNPITRFALHGVDWNVPLTSMNEWMDRFVAAANIEDPESRAAAMEQIESDIKALAGGFKEPWSIAGAVLSRRRASDKVSDLFVTLLCPAIGAVFQAESRIRTDEELLAVGVALAKYKADKGQYPGEPEELVPVYLKAIPADAFAGTPFVYKKRANGYLLYSLGANQVDDGGKGYDEEADDLFMEVPPRVKPKPVADKSEPAIKDADDLAPEDK